jgi:hypothetical protein
MFNRSMAAILAAALALTACAAPSQPYLDNAVSLCHNGNQQACGVVPTLQSQVQSEKNQQAREVGQGFLAVLGALALGAAAVADAYYTPAPTIYVYPYRRW